MKIENISRLKYLYKVMQYQPGIDLSKVEKRTITETQFKDGIVSPEIFNDLLCIYKSKHKKHNTEEKNNKKEGEKNDKNEKKEKNPSSLKVLLIPKSVSYKLSLDNKTHPEKIESFKDTIGIYYIPAVITNEGKLAPNVEKTPWIPYEFQYPFDTDICICSYKEKVNLNNSDYEGAHQEDKRNVSWELYYKEFVRYYESLTEAKWQDKELQDYYRRDFSFHLREDILILNDETVNAGSALCNLYAKLYDYKDRVVKDGSKLQDYLEQEHNEPFKLLNSILTTNGNKEEPQKDFDTKCMEEHLGTMGRDFPLAVSQRETVHNLNKLPIGSVLAVSGPPGTGKTTMLQAIVADMIVHAALKAPKLHKVKGKKLIPLYKDFKNRIEVNAPIIVASSTNNKAIKNIIDSFTDVFKLKKEELEKEKLCKRWIPELSSLAVYNPSSGQVEKARKEGYFTESDYSSVDSVKEKESFIHKFVDFAYKYSKEHEGDLPYYTDKYYTVKSLAYLASCLQLKIEDMRQELVDFVSLIKNVYSSEEGIEEQRRSQPIGQIEDREAVSELQEGLVYIGEKYNIDIKEALLKIAQTYHPDDKMDFKVGKLEDLQKKEKDMELEEIVNKMRLQDMNGFLDITLRCQMFWLSVHYFEAIWLIGLGKHYKGYKTSYDVRERLKDQAIATPCFVATFYRLPSVFKSESVDQFPYFHDIDLLIVDEAGQVSPEVSVPCFSLAKKALVVGDACQIPPVWKIQDQMMDLKIAHYEGIVPEDSEEYLSNVFSKSEFNCSNSSLMRIAQTACPITKDGKVGGLYLTEHRRCLKEIIEFCNIMMYNGILEPRRADAFIDNKFLGTGTYPMSRLVCEHSNSSSQGGSRVSYEEADAICNWLKKNYLYIKNESCYKGTEKKPFNPTKVISIITPFKAQANLIESKLKKTGDKDKNLEKDFYIIANKAVGTVHTFQGAESKIVIFSSVYGSSDSWTFINNNPNLVNVAVSRAKDYFILCGANYITSSKDGRISDSAMSDEEKYQNFISNPNIVNQFNEMKTNTVSKEETKQKQQDSPAEQLFEAIGEHEMPLDLSLLNKEKDR